MGRIDLRDIAKHFDLDFEELGKPTPPIVPVTYRDYDNMLHELTGLYLDELVEKLATKNAVLLVGHPDPVGEPGKKGDSHDR